MGGSGRWVGRHFSEGGRKGKGNACESRTQNRLLSVAALYHGDRSRRAPKVFERGGGWKMGRRATGESRRKPFPSAVSGERGVLVCETDQGVARTMQT